MASRINLPTQKQDKDFEWMCCDVLQHMFGEDYDIPNLYGRQGQKQHGIDIWSQSRSERGKYLVVQCKNYHESTPAHTRQILADIASAQELGVEIERMYVMIASEEDTHLQDAVAKASASSRFPVEIIFWGKISEVVQEDKKLLKRYYPNQVIESSEPALTSNFSRNTNPVIGREDKLQSIESLLAEQKGKNRLLFIKGIGGIGKSTLAKAYAENHEDEYDEILEVSGDNFRGLILQIMIKNWNANGLSPEQEYQIRLQLLHDLMEQSKTLLIVHDYNTSEDKEAQWSFLPCDILVTTWNDWGEIGSQLVIENRDLSLANAVDIIREYYTRGIRSSRNCSKYESLFEEQMDSVKELADFVDCHPLTLKLIANQMTCNQRNIISPTAMLADLRKAGVSEQKTRKFKHQHESGMKSETASASLSEHLYNVFVTALANNRLSDDEKEALRYMTLTSSIYGISQKRFEASTGLSMELLDGLEKGGWIEYDEEKRDYLALDDDASDDAGVFHIPMVISDVLYRQEGMVSTCDNSENYIDACEREDANLIGSEARLAYLAQWETLMRHVKEEESGQYASLIAGVADGYHKAFYSVTQLEKCLEYQEKALEIRLNIYGENHSDTSTSYNNVGCTYEDLGDVQKGLEYQEKALEIKLNIYGENHSDTATSYNNVGMSYDKLGDVQKGLEYQEKALEILQSVYGENHPQTAYSYNNVGYTYEKLGDVQKGLEYQEKALEILQSVYGEKHPETAGSYNNVGYTYEKLGDVQKGLKYKEKALEIRQSVYGEKHPDTARSYNNVGYTYYKLGDVQKGLEYLEKALEIRQSVYGEKHPDTASSYWNLSFSYFNHFDDYKKAYEYVKRAYDIWMATLGPEHPDTKMAKDELEYVQKYYDPINHDSRKKEADLPYDTTTRNDEATDSERGTSTATKAVRGDAQSMLRNLRKVWTRFRSSL